MRSLDDHEDGLDEAAWERALGGGRKKRARARKPAAKTAATVTTYIPCAESEVPDGLRFWTPKCSEGQMVEISYAEPGQRSGPDDGALYRRTIDAATRLTTYSRRVDR